jgi:CheY-like chemotaxis protein
MNPSIDILLVEDDPGDVRLALAVFERLQLAERCVVVNDGEEAIDFLRSSGRFSQRIPGLPRLVLLDLKMPRMNGFDLLERMKTDAALKLIPVVALTSSREERDVDRAYDLGVNGYVVKGIDFKDYQATLRALATVLGRHQRTTARFRGAKTGSCHQISVRTVERRARAAILNPWLWPLCRC